MQTGDLPNYRALLPKFRRMRDCQYIRSLGDLHGALMNNMSSFEKDQLFLHKPIDLNCSLERIRQLYCPPGLEFTDYIEAMSYMYMMNYISNHHVYRLDQFTMRFSIEARVPFLDHTVIEAAFTIPSHLKIKRGEQKYILRQVAKKYIDPITFSQKKKGFSLPMDYWIRNHLLGFVNEKLTCLTQRGIFDAKVIHNTLKNFMCRRSDDYTLWQLVGVELWLEEFIDA